MSDWEYRILIGAVVLIAIFTGGIYDRLAAIRKTLDTIADNTFDAEKERQKRGW